MSVKLLISKQPLTLAVFDYKHTSYSNNLLKSNN